MAVPSNHTLIPLNNMGIQILELMLDMKFTITNKTIYKLHLLLRHGDDVDNCDTGGFFRASYVLTNFHTTLDKLVNTVYNNNKNRYQFSICDEHLYIRACQGHSGKILDKLVPEHIYDIYSSDNNVFHRTTNSVSDSIFSPDNAINGLRPIRRQVHMAISEELSRKSNKFPIKIIVNVKKARRLKVVFFQASNGVILSYNKIPKSCLFLDM
jgi:RNA:NAD 2'-phosphotransferase (TPT1/KptA family)